MACIQPHSAHASARSISCGVMPKTCAVRICTRIARTPSRAVGRTRGAATGSALLAVVDGYRSTSRRKPCSIWASAGKEADNLAPCVPIA
ncbi:hypothetical protein BJP39_06125 [Streptomyces sp. CC77]|nr:hypothetical protein BJP39_06125 [Streptomyces sp. CC77]